MNLDFDPNNKIVTINDSGEIEFLPLYSAIREWEASAIGIAYPAILEGSGNIELPDGTRTPRCMIFINGWRLAVANAVLIIGGYVTARDKERNAYHPVVEEARNRVQLMHEFAAQPPGWPFVPIPRIRVDTSEEFEEATRRRFTEAPTTVVVEAREARATAVCVQTILGDMGYNSDEAFKAKALLEKHIKVLDTIIVMLEADGDIEAARKSLRDELAEVIDNFIKVIKQDGPIKGVLASMAIGLMAIAGVEVGAVIGALVAGPIVGIDAKALKNILTGKKKKRDKGK